MTADKNPLDEAVEQALDAFVFAPIGLLLDGPARFPKLVANGKTQVSTARMLGQFAVTAGRSEVEKRAKDIDGPIADVLRGLGLAPRPAARPRTSGPRPGTTPTTAPDSTPMPAEDDSPATKPTRKASAKKAGTKKAGTKKKASAGKKAAPKKKAAAKKSPAARKKKPAKKSAAKSTAATPDAGALPIPDYDSLSASQVVSRVRGLGATDLDRVAAYETANRGRKTVLAKVAQLRAN